MNCVFLTTVMLVYISVTFRQTVTYRTNVNMGKRVLVA